MNIEILLAALKAENDLVSSLYEKKQSEVKDQIIDNIETIINEIKEVLNKTKVIGLYSCYICEIFYLSVKPKETNSYLDLDRGPSLNYITHKYILDREHLQRESIEQLQKILFEFKTCFRPKFYQYVEKYIKEYNERIEKKKAFIAK